MNGWSTTIEIILNSINIIAIIEYIQYKKVITMKIKKKCGYINKMLNITRV